MFTEASILDRSNISYSKIKQTWFPFT